MILPTEAQQQPDLAATGILSVRRLGLFPARILVVLLALAMGACIGTSVTFGTARAESQGVENTLKAAFLYHFIGFVSWPDAAFDEEDAFDVAVLGPDLFGDLLEQALGTEDDEGRRFRFHRVDDVESLKSAHMLFVSPDYDGDLENVFRSFAERPVLTVSDREDFALEGGMIGMFVEDGRLRFEVNQAAVEQAGLSMSSRMLVLARILDEED